MNSLSSVNRVSEIEITKDHKLIMLQNLGIRVKQLQNDLPKTNFNLPLSYIDPQVILEYIAANPEQELTQSEINSSKVDIDYIEGFPTVGGLPFWERLDCEPLDYYKLYKLYREQIDTVSPRSFEKLIFQTNSVLNARYLSALANIYHWHIRNSAYDMFSAYLLEKERDKQIKIMEGNHIKTAEKIRNLCEKYLDLLTDKPDFMANFKPNMFNGLLELSFKMDRLSLGLPATSPEDEKEKDKETKTSNITINQSNTQNTQEINISESDKTKYLQEIVDVLKQAKALPKELEAQGDVMEETLIIEQGEDNEDKM